MTKKIKYIENIIINRSTKIFKNFKQTTNRLSIMPITILHNPRCSKSRQTLELLIKQGIKPAINQYLITPPTVEKIKEILKKLGYTPRDLMRKKEDAYIEYNLDNQTLSDDYLIDFMIKHPILIERPIVLTNEKAAIGRPPEKVLEIL
mgnify:FL=1